MRSIPLTPAPEFSLRGYDYTKEMTKPINCRNASEARDIARFYMADDLYLKYNPDRMLSIAYQLLSYNVLTKELNKIIEVCSAHCTIDFVTIKSKM